LQYLNESFPWTTPEELAALAQFQNLAAEESEAAGEVYRFLMRRREPVPYLGSYPMEFTSINYVSLEHLFPLVADHTEKAIVHLEKDVSDIQDSEARALVQNIVDMKRRHLQTFRALAAAYPETHSTVR
jgi:rubrerythrin